MMRVAKILCASLIMLGAFSRPGSAQEVRLTKKAPQEFTIAGRKVSYWEPHDIGDTKFPLVIFSHGFKGCATQSTFLAEALADDGYFVAAPTHQDADCGESFTRETELPQVIFGEIRDWDQNTYVDRAKDIQLIVAVMKLDPKFANVDFDRIGLIGHALGGYTVIGLAGGWPDWYLPGVKAVVALSPFSQPYVYRHTLANLKAPIMYELGTRDTGISSSAQDDQTAYTMTPKPKYLLDYDGANRFAWTDLTKSYQPSITTYTLAFLDHYLKGDPATPALTNIRLDVARMKYDSELGHASAGSP